MRRALLIERGAVVRRAALSALEVDGWDVVTADASTALETAATTVPELILLDAYEEAEHLGPAMKATANLESVPLVIMVSDADTEVWVQKSQADDAISKPFSADALRTMAAHVVRRQSSPRISGAPLPSDGVDKVLERALFDAARAMSGTYPGPAAQLEIARLIADAFDDAHGVSFRGRAEHLPLGDVMQLLAQGHSGVLHVERNSDETISICFRNGAVDFVRSEGLGDDFLLGRYLVRNSFVDKADVEHASRRPIWLGKSLLEDGVLAAEELQQALREQSSERIYEALRWSRAHFRFERFAVLEEAESAALGLPPTALLMEGLRRVDEWRLIEQQVNSFDLVYVRARARPEGAEDLSATEERILGIIDGERTVGELIEASGLAPFDVCKTLYQFALSHLIRRRR